MKAEPVIILIEDEDYNLRLLEGMLLKLRPDWNYAASFDSIAGVVEWFENQPQPDLIFMDIQLTDGLCFEIFEKVKVDSFVIFTTAFDNYAVQAFKVNSIDYLLKPFKERELEQALEKFENLSGIARAERLIPNYADIMQAIRQGEKKYRKRFLVSKGDAYITLETANIAYFHNENRITTATTFNGQTHIVDFTLDALEDQLDAEQFYRANRQLIVSQKAVERIENFFGGKLKLRLKPAFEGDLMISRLKATDFKRWMGQ